MTAEIEVGADAAEIRLWRAKEEFRQGELRLSAQLSSLQAMEARASSVLTWSVGAIVALTAASPHLPLAGRIAALLLGVSAAICVAASWPRLWTYAGYLPSDMRALQGQTELEVLEQAVSGIEAACFANQARIIRFGQYLRLAWTFFVFAAAFELLSLFTHPS